ncbi:MAG: hypothetical protein Kow0092_13540 [Deferrisomatales bacterium]
MNTTAPTASWNASLRSISSPDPTWGSRIDGNGSPSAAPNPGEAPSATATHTAAAMIHHLDRRPARLMTTLPIGSRPHRAPDYGSP